MSDEDKTDGKSSQLLSLLAKSQTFAERLLKENEGLKLKVAALEQRCQAAEIERNGLRRSIDDVTVQTSTASEQYLEIEEQINSLANLHVANWQLHATLDFRKVLATTLEICINLVGADDIVVFITDDDKQTLVPAAQRGTAKFGSQPKDEGVIGQAVVKQEVFTREPRETPTGEPIVVVPLAYSGRVVGAVAIFSFLPQKTALTDLDYQIFKLLGQQAATALHGAYLAGASAQAITEDGVRIHLGGSDDPLEL